jgi:hypothetical protein
VNWASKSPQQFLDLGLKTKWAIVVPQNQQEDEDDVGHASRSNGLLHLEASRARVPNLASRLLEAWHGWCIWHHHGGRVQMKLIATGCIRLFYAKFAVFIVLGPKGILVFWLDL